MSDSVRSNGEVADIFRGIADIMDIQGENTFKVRAYRNAVKTLENLEEPVAHIAAENRLDDIPGFGDAIRAKTIDILQSGTTAQYERLRDAVPSGVIEMVNIPGIGPKTIRQLWEDHGIEDVQTLELKARNGDLALLPGLGEKSAAKILAAIERSRRFANKYRIGEALPMAESIVAQLNSGADSVRAYIVGSLRRGEEVAAEVDLLLSCPSDLDIKKMLASVPMLAHVEAGSHDNYSAALHNGMPVNVFVTRPDSFGSKMVETTGPNAFTEHIKANTKAVVADEKSVFREMKVSFVPPELRDSEDAMSRAAANSLPNLITIEDIRGDVHAHTTASDGTLSILEMARAAVELGYEYMAITDHSRSLRIANGLTPDRLVEQIEQVRDAEQSAGIRIFSGSEVDILADGTLDFEDTLLAKLDIVIASAHLYNGQDIESQTSRVLRAINNPHVDLIAHPTGRVINRRDPFAINLEAIYAAASQTGTALEINAAPERLDLKDTQARQAAECGVSIMINTDAHSANNYRLMRYGIMTARRAWLTPANVVNCRPLKQFEEWLQR